MRRFRQNRRSSGKYADVLAQYGRAGFGVPSKAPEVGSFPLYPIGRARYALAIVSSGQYDHGAKRRVREQVVRRALKAHPSLRRQWRDSRPNLKNPESTMFSFLTKRRRNPMNSRIVKSGREYRIYMDGEYTGKYAFSEAKAMKIARRMIQRAGGQGGGRRVTPERAASKRTAPARAAPMRALRPRTPVGEHEAAARKFARAVFDGAPRLHDAVDLTARDYQDWPGRIDIPDSIVIGRQFTREDGSFYNVWVVVPEGEHIAFVYTDAFGPPIRQVYQFEGRHVIMDEVTRKPATGILSTIR